DPDDLKRGISPHLECYRTPAQLLVQNTPRMDLFRGNSVTGVRNLAQKAKNVQIASSGSESMEHYDSPVVWT
ncbi:hypothetical protein, partial [Paenibacillus odorifer]|uniref:hypothetical protein n=1 Tax=Paenibacillus odorifer TaxID=189426 RepID=UPI00097AA28B